MLPTTPTKPSRITRARRALAEHPGRVVVALIPVGIAIMLIVDAILGADAEYYNATHWFEAVGNLIAGGAVADGPTFIMNQDDLGNGPAMLAGAALLILEPALVLAAIVYPGSLIARRRARRTQ